MNITELRLESSVIRFCCQYLKKLYKNKTNIKWYNVYVDKIIIKEKTENEIKQ